VILPDVNVLIYAFRESLPEHGVYSRWLRRAAVAPEGLLLTDLALIGFVRVVTNSRAVDPVSSAGQALNFVAALRASKSAVMARTVPATWTVLEGLVEQDRQIRANLVPDAYLAATALSHNALVATRDRGFARYPGLRWFDPAVESV
jgi:toxin-antitoxin system PIN domain toxin